MATRSKTTGKKNKSIESELYVQLIDPEDRMGVLLSLVHEHNEAAASAFIMLRDLAIDNRVAIDGLRTDLTQMIQVLTTIMNQLKGE